MVEEMFKVREEKLRTESGNVIEGRKAIVREDTGDVLGLVSDKYKLVRHEEVLRSIYQVVPGLNLKESSRSLCKNGAVMFTKFFMEGNGRKEMKVGDIVKFGIEVFNSYNGSLPVGVVLIAERLKCSNGMVVPETITRFAVKHYGGLDLGEVRRKSVDVLANVDSVFNRWKQWNETDVDEQSVKTLFSKLFGNRLREKLFVEYLREREGETKWDVYQYLMRYSTHDVKVRKGNEQNRRLLQWGLENGVAEKISRWN